MIGRISFWSILYIIIFWILLLGTIIYKKSTLAGYLYFPVALVAILYIHKIGTRFLGQKMLELIAGITLSGVLNALIIVSIGKLFH